MLSSIITGVYKVGDVAIENILKSYIVVNPNNSKIIDAWSDPPYSAELKMFIAKKYKILVKKWKEILTQKILVKIELLVKNINFGQKLNRNLWKSFCSKFWSKTLGQKLKKNEQKFKEILKKKMLGKI